MRDRLDDFGDARIAAITFARSEELPPYRDHLGLPFPLLADPDRDVYRAFDLGRGSLHRIWGPGTLRLYAHLLRKGRRLRLPSQDTRQLGGDFVIDGRGRLAAAFRAASPDDRPAIDALISAVTAARNTSTGSM